MVELAFQRGVLFLGAGPNSIRVAPPLVVTRAQADEALDVLEECIETVGGKPHKAGGPSWTVSETRLFDATSGALAWTGIMDTRETDNLDAALTQYINAIFDAMVNDRVL